MNTPQRRFLYWAILVVSAGCVASMVMAKSAFLEWFALHRTPVLDYYFYYVTSLGEPIAFTLAGLLLWMSSWRKMVFVPILGGVVTGIAYLLKHYFSHERPSLYLDRIGWEGPRNVLDYYMHTGHQSFPSGHSMAAWALFAYIALVAGRSWVSALCLVAAVSVSLSRVYLMVHFLQDVVAGAAVGLLMAACAYYLHQRWSAVHVSPGDGGRD